MWVKQKQKYLGKTQQIEIKVQDEVIENVKKFCVLGQSANMEQNIALHKGNKEF